MDPLASCPSLQSLCVLIAASVQLDMSLDEAKAAPQEAGPHGEASAAVGGENSAPAVPAEPGSSAQQAAAAEDADGSESLKQQSASAVSTPSQPTALQHTTRSQARSAAAPCPSPMQPS